MLRRVFFTTSDDVELAGLLSTPESKTEEVIISIHGMQSNCMKKRESILEEKITNTGIAYFSFNNRGQELMAYTKKTSGEKILNGGAVYEEVLDSYHDIRGAIQTMVDMGFTKIHLQGHSLGCTKIVYAYNRLKQEKSDILEYVKSIILLSLVDIPDLQKYDLGDKYQYMLDYANKKEAEGKLDELMPKESFEHPISVKTYLRYFKYNEEIDVARFHDKTCEFKELNNIEVPLFIRWGNVYELVIQPFEELIPFLKEKIKNPKLDMAYIDGADHGYSGKEEILANDIIKFMNNKNR